MLSPLLAQKKIITQEKFFEIERNYLNFNVGNKKYCIAFITEILLPRENLIL